MLKRNRKALPTDVNQMAHLLVERSTEEKAPETSPAVVPPVSKAISRVMAQMGRRGGKIGGKRRMVTMTDEQRREVASKAAVARWKKAKEPSAR
jgi:hypothetical protein